MKILKQASPEFGTNCYILDNNDTQIIIDPGIAMFDFVKKNVKKPLAILNTHGHFDHVWSNARLTNEFNIPIYIHKDDTFMLQGSTFAPNLEPSKASFEVDNEEFIEIESFSFRFLHFAGHTPGCCMIEFEDVVFSGDFIFNGSIGRWDFPYSDANEMKKSLMKFKSIPYDKTIYAGHGSKTTIKKEQANIDYWLGVI